jgi:hypothetical protein
VSWFKTNSSIGTLLSEFWLGARATRAKFRNNAGYVELLRGIGGAVWERLSTLDSSQKLPASVLSARSTPLVVAYAASFSPNMVNNDNFDMTLTGNVTLANPTNFTPGSSGIIRFIQDATGSRLLSGVGTYWKTGGGTLPTLTTTANSIDVLVYYVDSASRITYALLKDVK